MIRRGRLTPAQLRVLREMAAEGSLVRHGTGYRTGVTDKPLPHAVRSIHVLWRHDLCTEKAYDVRRWWTLTSKGWETLENEGVIAGTLPAEKVGHGKTEADGL